MTIASAIATKQQQVANSYTAISNKGGTLPVTQNLTNLATAISSIPSGGGSTPVIESLSVTPTTSSQTITASGGVDGYSPITVNAVDNTIDSNIIAGNIKKGVTILDVTGTYEGSGGGSGYSEVPNYQVVNGVARQRSITLTGNEFSDITSIDSYGLYYAFYGHSGLIGLLNLSSLNSVGDHGLWNAFYTCINLTSVNLSSLTSIGDYGLYGAFYSCRGLTSVNLSSLTSVGRYGLDSAFQDCINLTSVNLSSLTSIGDHGLDKAFYSCKGLTSVDLSSLTTVGTNGLYYAFSNCPDLMSVDLSSLTSIGENGLYYAFYSSNLTVLSFPALSSENIANSSFVDMLRGCTDVTVHFPIELESTMSSWNTVMKGFSGTRTIVLFDLNACELTFAITPNSGNRLIVNGDELSSNIIAVAKSSTVSYQIYNSSYGLYISEYLAPDTDSATVTVDITTPTYNTISLDTGVSGLTATITVDGTTYTLTETGSTGVYTINLYKTLSGSVSVNYFINGGSSYMDENGTLTYSNADISETITMQPAQDITFTRPNLTANGTMGGDSFAVRSGTVTTAWRAVDSNSTSYVTIYSPYTFEFYNPKALKVSQLTFSFSGSTNGITGVTIEGSNDDTNWTQVSSWSGESSASLTVNVNSSAYYKYHKLTMTPYRFKIDIYDLGITAVYKG